MLDAAGLTLRTCSPGASVPLSALELVVAKGPQVHVMGFEIYVLAIINELYFRRMAREVGEDLVLGQARARLQEKIAQLHEYERSNPRRRHPFEFFDFGVRRRFSGTWHEEVATTLAREVPQYFKGSSNVFLARKLGLTPIGTMAHEYLQTFQAMDVQLKGFQKAALESWVQEYRGDLGTALTCLLYTSPSPRDRTRSRMPSSA